MVVNGGLWWSMVVYGGLGWSRVLSAAGPKSRSEVPFLFSGRKLSATLPYIVYLCLAHGHRGYVPRSPWAKGAASPRVPAAAPPRGVGRRAQGSALASPASPIGALLPVLVCLAYTAPHSPRRKKTFLHAA